MAAQQADLKRGASEAEGAPATTGERPLWLGIALCCQGPTRSVRYHRPILGFRRFRFDAFSRASS